MQKEVDDKSKVIEMKEHQLTEANRYIKKLQVKPNYFVNLYYNKNVIRYNLIHKREKY